MDHTPFAGLTVLEPGESIQEDNASFMRENPRKIDRLLQIGAVTHRHDAHQALGPPVDAPSATAFPSGGQIPADLPLYVGYTLRDAHNGETLLSEISTVTTELPLDVPDQAPSATADYTAGSLVADTYYYAVSVVDSGGGETPIGPDVSVDRDPGYASGQVNLSGLMDPVNVVGGISWRLWRAQGGGDFFLIATGATDTFTDDGLQCTDCGAAPVPDNLNFTNGTNRLEVMVPSGQMGTASAFSLYVSVASDFADDCLVGTYPAEFAGTTIDVTSLLFEAARPPDVPTALPGASKIDPDTELIDWHWKRPVVTVADLPSGEAGDIRLVEDELRLYTPGSAAASGAGGWSPVVSLDREALNVEEDGGAPVLAGTVAFKGSGGVGVDVSDQGGGTALVTITGGAAGGGGASLKPALRLHASANQAIADNTNVPIQWGTEIYDSLGMHDPATPDLIVVPDIDGNVHLWEVVIGIEIDWSATGTKRGVYLWDSDWLGPVATELWAASPVLAAREQREIRRRIPLFPLVPLQVRVVQDSGSALTLRSSALPNSGARDAAGFPYVELTPLD